MSITERSVAVIIAAWKAERVIGRAVTSALAQPEAAEVVVCVDASPDGTADAARAADDGSGRLKVIVLEKNGGPSAARNAGIAASSAPWITVLDDDDFMDAGRLGRLLSLSSDQDFVADDLLLVEEGAEDGPRRTMWFDGAGETRAVDLAYFVEANIPNPARARRELGFLKPLMRRSFLEQCGLRYDEGMRLGEDYDLYARALAKGARFLLTPAQGYVAVRRPASLSGAHGAKELLALRESDTAVLREDVPAAGRAALIRHRRSTDKKYQWQRLIDAVKARNIAEAMACFTRHPAVSAFLIARLWEQVRLRALSPSPLVGEGGSPR